VVDIVYRWLIPFIGHMGICTMQGVIRDFAGPYFVSVSRYCILQILFTDNCTVNLKLCLIIFVVCIVSTYNLTELCKVM